MARLLIILVFFLAACAPQNDAFLQAASYSTATADVLRDTQLAAEALREQTQTAEAWKIQALRVHLQETEQAHALRATDSAATAIAQATAEARAVVLTGTANAQEQYALATTYARQAQETAVSGAATERAFAVTKAVLNSQATGTQVALSAWIGDKTATASAAVQRDQLTSTVVVAIGKAEATAVAAHAEMAELAVSKERSVAGFAAWLEFFAWPLLVLAFVVLTMVSVRLWLSNRVLYRDSKGAAPLLLQDGKLVSPDNMILPWHDPGQPLFFTEAAHSRLASENARVRALMALPQGGVSRAAQGIATRVSNPVTPLPQTPVEAPQVVELPEVAPWQYLLNRWSGGALPLGLGEKGLIVNPLDSMPHLLFAGQTGSGKTRQGLRPLVAAALVTGWQVIIIDKSGVDFQPHQTHPNCRYIQIDSENPGRAAALMRGIYSQVIERQRTLAAAGYTTWDRWPGKRLPQVLVVVDEFSNLADLGSTSERDDLWRWSRMIAAEGRKAGVVLAIALQDPTAKSIDLRIRRNCKPVVFRVQDEAASRVVLGSDGASLLPVGQFLTRIGGIQRGVGFAPTDEEIEAYLGSRNVQQYPEFEIVETEFREVTDHSEKIISLFNDGLSARQIEMQVFGYHGGRAHDVVKSTIERYKGDTTGDSGPVVAL